MMYVKGPNNILVELFKYKINSLKIPNPSEFGKFAAFTENRLCRQKI